MNRTRRLRVLTALVALVSMLFTQIALASYSCPELGRALAQAAAQAQVMHKSCCPQHDVNNPGLCHAHGQVGSQSAEVSAQPPVMPFIPATLVQSIAPIDVAPLEPRAAPLAFLLAPGAAPPISIRHCCLRN